MTAATAASSPASAVFGEPAIQEFEKKFNVGIYFELRFAATCSPRAPIPHDGMSELRQWVLKHIGLSTSVALSWIVPSHASLCAAT